jgi:mRNA interferase RelE/StbE
MHKVIILPKALGDLTKLDKTTAKRILESIEWFSQHIEAITPIPLKSNLSGFFKLRVGDWRVIYEIDHKQKTLYVHKIGHRREIYQ